MLKSKKTTQKAEKPLKSDKIMNLYNPKLAGMIEPAFEADGVKYYNFKQDSEGRYGRYIIMQAFLQEYYLRVDLGTLQGNIGQLKKWLNPTITKEGTGTLQLGKALELLEIMEQRAKIAFEPDTVYRLASCMFFDDKEILSNYDKAYNEQKIARWKEANVTDFFFNRLFQELTHLKITSKTDLENYLHQVPELLKGWKQMEGILSR
jgi:hypothetical protein